MKLRIESTGALWGGTKVFDAVTGQEIHGIRAVTFRHEAGMLPVITLEFLGMTRPGPSFEVSAVGTLTKIGEVEKVRVQSE